MMAINRQRSSVLSALLGLVGFAGLAQAASKAPDTIYLGDVVTMDAARPAAEAVAVKGQTIVAVGDRATVLALKGRTTRVVDLGQKALLPGFIDSHGHITVVAMQAHSANLSSPPVGTVRSIADLQQALRRHIEQRKIPAGGWVVGWGYDDAQLAERRHPTRADLDAVSTEHLIYVSHASGHLGAANSRMLQFGETTADTPNPAGGVIRREADGRQPNGVLEEIAHLQMSLKIPRPDLTQRLEMLRDSIQYFASQGITTAQEGGAMPEALDWLEEAAKRGMLPLDVVAFRFWMPLASAFPADRRFGVYNNRLKIGGIKLMLDGSPQGKTAYLSEPYLKPPLGQKADYRGYPAMPPDAVRKGVYEALSRQVPILAHANGDAAAQMLVDAVDAVRAETGNRTTSVTMIHAQTVRDDQLDRMAKLAMIPSFFVGHTLFWGDWHRDEVLGLPRADRISPTRSALDRGIAFTLHTDSPVTPPDMLQSLWSAVNRRTRSNDILGPQQRLTTAEALAGLTINGARQYGEEAIKGSIAPGKRADFVILSCSPLRVPGERLRSLHIEETVSQGLSIYQRSATDLPDICRP